MRSEPLIGFDAKSLEDLNVQFVGLIRYNKKKSMGEYSLNMNFLNNYNSIYPISLISINEFWVVTRIFITLNQLFN